MNIYDDSSLERGFINKKKILEYVSEEEIFELVFEYIPEEMEYVLSPFREDNSPGCWFEREIQSEKLRFKDFGNTQTIRGIKMKNIDCFDAIQVFYNIPNFYKTLEFIKNKFIDKIEDTKAYSRPLIKGEITNIKEKRKRKVKILIATRDFTARDGKYWIKYEIAREELIEDKVFPVSKYKLINTRKGDFVVTVRDLCYAYTNFKEGRRKLYKPLKTGKYRFVTNCIANDVGGLETLVPFGRQLVITKSYKDYRVLKNQGLNVVWFQNEGAFPNKEKLNDLIKRFDKVIILFDNDRAGIEAANKLVKLINSKIRNKARKVYLPEELLLLKIKDPSDLIYYKGRKKLLEFLSENNVL